MSANPTTRSAGRTHWERIYGGREPDRLSWYERTPETSLAWISRTGVPLDAAILDAGGGASGLAGELVRAGYTDVTVADVSASALERARAALGEDARRIAWVRADLRGHDFGRRFDLWHDRAVFHFMVERADRDAYLATLRRSLCPGGQLILATFGPAGPTRCSGLPVRRYGIDRLADLLGPDFAVVSSQLVDHRTPSGEVQQLLYAQLRREPSR
jgi:SAM-dependent methyltransferase